VKRTSFSRWAARGLATASLGVALLNAAPLSAENSWTDGSPPPDDFGLQPTPLQSDVSAYNWLYSADGGAAVYQSWTASGVNRTLLEPLSGGVATGMSSANDVKPAP
jgi:hypothetical protein